MYKIKLVIQHSGDIDWIRLYNERGDGLVKDMYKDNHVPMFNKAMNTYVVDLDENKALLGVPTMIKNTSLFTKLQMLMKESILAICKQHKIFTISVNNRIELAEDGQSYIVKIDNEPKYKLTPTIKLEELNGNKTKESTEERVGISGESSEVKKDNPADFSTDLFG